MFRRSRSDDSSAAENGATAEGSEAFPKSGGKGRPTPKRREAEAAARARARGPRSRKEQRQQQREASRDARRRAQAGMKRGDERYLLPRDQGPMRRFIRDFVDARFLFSELSMPLVLVIWVLTLVPSTADFGSTMMIALLLGIVVDLTVLRFRVRRELVRRFPDQSYKGTTFYAVTRAMQIRPLRMPKAQVTVGTSLKDRRYH